MSFRRFYMTAGVLMIPVVVLILLQTFIGISWKTVQCNLEGISLKGESLNVKGGIISSLSISLRQLDIEIKPHQEKPSGSPTLSSLPLKLNYFSKMKVQVGTLNMGLHSISQAQATLKFDRKYAFIDLTELAFKKYHNEELTLDIDSFAQKNCVQIDLLKKKVFFSFFDHTSLSIGSRPSALTLTAEGYGTSTDFLVNGILSLKDLPSAEQVSYQWSPKDIVLQGEGDNKLIGSLESEEVQFVGQWRLHYIPEWDSQLLINMQVSKLLYNSTHKILRAHYSFSHTEEDFIQGNLHYDCASQHLKAEFTEMVLPSIGNFKGKGSVYYQGEMIIGAFKGAIDDISVPRRNIAIDLMGERLEITHSDPISQYWDWRTIELYRDCKTSQWQSIVRGSVFDTDWTLHYEILNQEYDLFIGRDQGFPIYATGHLSWTAGNVCIERTIFTMNIPELKDYTWKLRYNTQSAQVEILGRDLQSDALKVSLGVRIQDTAKWALNPFDFFIECDQISATAKNSDSGVSIKAKTVQADQIWHMLQPLYQALYPTTQSTWFESPYAFFKDPVAIGLTADRFIFKGREFHKVSIDHNYDKDAIEHRWNIRYRDGSACLREYFDKNIWKHEATIILSSGEACDPSFKGGIWALSLYHDLDNDPSIVWHLRVEDLFIKNWQSDLFTGLNILSGSAFMLKQTRSLMEDGLVVDRVVGRGFIKKDTVDVEYLDVHAGAVSIQATGHYYRFIDDLKLDIVVRPKLSQAISSVATILSPWTAGLAWIGLRSFGKEVDTWNEQMYHLRGSSESWEIVPWDPEVLSLTLSED